MDDLNEWISRVEQRAKSNTHRIDDLEVDNKALRALASSVSVLAAKQEIVEKNVCEIRADVKALKAVPAGRWEAVLRALLTALAAGLIGFALARLGIGG